MTERLRLDTVNDYRLKAEAVLPPPVRDFVAGGSESETTLAANRRALDRVTVLSRVLRGVDQIDLAATPRRVASRASDGGRADGISPVVPPGR